MASYYDPSSQDNIAPAAANPHADRITAILQQRAQPIQYTADQTGLASEAAQHYALAGQDRGVQQILEQVIRNPMIQNQDRELESAKGLYDLFEQKRAQGDKQAQNVSDVLDSFTSDPEARGKMLEWMHSLPEQIDASNKNKLYTLFARGKRELGIQTDYERSKIKDDLDIQKTRAEIANMGKSASNTPADVQSFLFMQNLPPDQRKAFMELKGKGAGLKPTEMKEIFDQEDVINSASDSLSILGQMESLNALPTYEGPMAAKRAYVGSVTGSTEADNTLELDNLGKNLAASMLKTTFTGAISNAEREFLQDLQASSSKTKAQRQRIIDNGKSLIEARAKRAQEKQVRIQSGDYQTTPAELSKTNLGGKAGWGIERIE